MESEKGVPPTVRSYQRTFELLQKRLRMVVADKANATCKIYEVKHSKEQAKEQYRHLIDEEKLKSTEFRCGKITKKLLSIAEKIQLWKTESNTGTLKNI